MGLINFSQITDGTGIDAADVNSPLNTIYNDYNGNVDDSNISASANIAGSKLASGGVDSTKINFGGAGAGIWWEEIGRTTLAIAGDTITVSSLAARKYLKVYMISTATGGTTNGNITFNGDVGANYAARVSANGAADATASAQTSLGLFQAAAADDKFFVAEIVNISTKNKILQGTMMQQNSTTAPGRLEFAAVWVNTSAQISSITLTNTGTGDFAIGSEIIVLGHN